MNELLKKYKNTLVIVAVVVAAFIAYSLFYKPDTGSVLTQSNVNPAQTAVEQELIGLLLELRSIELDTAVFEDERFRGLQDFSQEIIAEPVGRDNPFAPIGQ